MNKIIDVVRNMITNSSKISNVEKKINMFYFSYKGYMWAIWVWNDQNTDESGVSMAYYPFAKNISEIPDQKDYIVYSSDEFESGQALFNKLYIIIKEKYFDVEKAFDEMLKD